MSKELEYIQRQINIVKQQIEGSKAKIIVTDTVTKHQYDYYERELQTLESIEKSLLELQSIKEANPSEALETLKNMLIGNGVNDNINDYVDNLILPIKQALQRLESIDNADSSEALECLEQFLNEMTYCLEHPKEYAKGYEKQIFWKYKNTFETTIKQALLKSQEPKQYLKWEDLEFEHTPKIIDVKLNDNKYTLVVGFNVAGYNLAILRNDKQQYYFLEADKQFFNDLHLERVEE